MKLPDGVTPKFFLGYFQDIHPDGLDNLVTIFGSDKAEKIRTAIAQDNEDPDMKIFSREERLFSAISIGDTLMQRVMSHEQPLSDFEARFYNQVMINLPSLYYEKNVQARRSKEQR